MDYSHQSAEKKTAGFSGKFRVCICGGVLALSILILVITILPSKQYFLMFQNDSGDSVEISELRIAGEPVIFSAELQPMNRKYRPDANASAVHQAGFFSDGVIEIHARYQGQSESVSRRCEVECGIFCYVQVVVKPDELKCNYESSEDLGL